MSYLKHADFSPVGTLFEGIFLNDKKKKKHEIALQAC